MADPRAVLDFALISLPKRYRNYTAVTVLPQNRRRHIVARLQYRRYQKILKIFMPDGVRSSSLPLESELAAKEKWFASRDSLRAVVPRICCNSLLSIDADVTSYVLMDCVALPTAAATVLAQDLEAFVRQLGVFCSRLQQTRSKGYGLRLSGDSSQFLLKSWEEFVQERIESSFLYELYEIGLVSGEQLETILLRLTSMREPGCPVLFHQDLLHNWDNIFVSPSTLEIKAIIDWERAGSGGGLVTELSAARYALFKRECKGFNWENFLKCFLSGYQIPHEEYGERYRESVNALSLLYAVKKLWNTRKLEDLALLEELMENSA